MEKQQPEHFYQQQLTQTATELSGVKRRLLLFSMGRLVVFLAALYPFFFTDFDLLIKLAWCLVFVVLFFVLISKYTDLRLHKNRLQQRQKLCEAELKALNGDFSFFGNGTRFINPQHAFSYDMDLFGNRSFFQSLNRTGTPESEALLAELITSNNITTIIEKQNVVKELASKPAWCLDFRTHQTLQEEPVEQQRVVDQMIRHQRLLPSKGALLALIYGGVSLALIVLAGLQVIAWQALLVPFFIGLLVTSMVLKRVAKISQQSSHLAANFRHMGETLKLIESQKWHSELLVNAAAIQGTAHEKHSAALVDFAKILAALDQRNNIFFALIANGFFLWDLRHGSRAEQWILANASRIQTVFEQINRFDAFASLATYAFTHPAFTYPQPLTEGNVLIAAEGAGHPLIPASRCVTSSFAIHEKEFFVITGANMAGKSTFLRTVGISLAMANAGLPVFAASFRYKPVRLISSMRSSDSLINDESYFFAELRRLKFVVDEIEQQRYFIILDEILKGTNSKDKEMGSKKFLQRLSGSNSSGLIATHDLSLCDLAETNKAIRNYYFDAEIVNDELHFDYRFKTGICQNMNASFLLRKMGIVD